MFKLQSMWTFVSDYRHIRRIGKVLFWQAFFCSQDGGFPSPRWGVPQSKLGGYSCLRWIRVPPWLGLGYPPPQDRRASTCYVVGGMPLAVMQEDFLVYVWLDFIRIRFCLEQIYPVAKIWMEKSELLSTVFFYFHPQMKYVGILFVASYFYQCIQSSMIELELLSSTET